MSCRCVALQIYDFQRPRSQERRLKTVRKKQLRAVAISLSFVPPKRVCSPRYKMGTALKDPLEGQAATPPGTGAARKQYPVSQKVEGESGR